MPGLLRRLRVLHKPPQGVSTSVVLGMVSFSISIDDGDSFVSTYITLHLHLTDFLLLSQTIVVVAVQTALVAGLLGSLTTLGERAIGVSPRVSVGVRGVLLLGGDQSRYRYRRQYQ